MSMAEQARSLLPIGASVRVGEAEEEAGTAAPTEEAGAADDARGRGWCAQAAAQPPPRPESSGLMPALPPPGGAHARFGEEEAEEEEAAVACPREEEQKGGEREGEAAPWSPPRPRARAPGGAPAPAPAPAPPPRAPLISLPRAGPPTDPDLHKYWRARYSMWGPVFDAGIAMDREGWFSATPRAIAVHQAGRLVRAARKARGGEGGKETAGGGAGEIGRAHV